MYRSHRRPKHGARFGGRQHRHESARKHSGEQGGARPHIRPCGEGMHSAQREQREARDVDPAPQSLRAVRSGKGCDLDRKKHVEADDSPGDRPLEPRPGVELPSP